MTARQGTQIEQVYNEMRTTQSDLDRVQRIAVERGTRSRGISVELARGCKPLHLLVPGRRYGRRSPLTLNICLSTHLSHTTETSTLSRIKCERYIFLLRSVFVRSLKFVNYVWLGFRLYFYYGYTTAPSPTLRCSSYWKGAFGLNSTSVTNFIYHCLLGLLLVTWNHITV